MFAGEEAAVLLDKCNIPVGGYDKIEACDVLYKNANNHHYFIHVKHKHSGSKGVAHLFAQGDASLTLLRNQDQKFLQGIATLTNQTPEDITAINGSDIHIVYLIIAKQGNSQALLPLFTKIALSRTINSLISKNAKSMWEFVGHTNNIGTE